MLEEGDVSGYLKFAMQTCLEPKYSFLKVDNFWLNKILMDDMKPYGKFNTIEARRATT
jgi:hypothetical protein